MTNSIRKSVLLTVCLLLAGFASASTIVLNATGDGWCNNRSSVCNNTNTSLFDNTAATGSNYANAGQYNNWYAFDLSSVTGNITGAYLSLYNDPRNSVSESNATYNVYNSTGFSFSGLVGGSQLASINAQAQNGVNPVIINLNATGLSMLDAAEGGQFIFGGTLVNAVGPGDGYGDIIFGWDFGNEGNNLVIATSPATVPEPASFILFGSGVIALAGITRRKLHR